MMKNNNAGESKKNSGALNSFEHRRELGPIEDRNEYEQRLKTLPPQERELARESARLADLSQYFSAQKIDIPPDALEQVSALRRLGIPERIRALKRINKDLMEHLSTVGRHFGIQQ